MFTFSFFVVEGRVVGGMVIICGGHNFQIGIPKYIMEFGIRIILKKAKVVFMYGTRYFEDRNIIQPQLNSDMWS